MTTSVLFLLAAVVLSVVGCASFLLRHRKPTSLDHGIDSFARQMQALAPGAWPMVREPADRRSPAESRSVDDHEHRG